MAMTPITPASPESHSVDIVAGNISQLKGLFPEVFTESVDGKDSINFEVLKQLLGSVVDEREEKFGLNWHGKRKARELALTPSTGTLRPCSEDSVDWDTTQNLMIEGDNLEVLKLLQKSYASKIKLIYIDPPYNTGKDFVYLDNFQDGIKNYLELTGQIESGRKVEANTDASGRYHTDWLNMMYPRLKLARTLLREDGLLFISIDDNEVDSLRKICVEIFGEENFIAQFVWNTEGHTDNQFDVKVNHEYIILYARNASSANLGHVVDPNTREESNLWKGFAENSITKNGPANPPSEINLPVGFPCIADEIDLPPNKPSSAFFDELDSHGYILREMSDRFDISYPIRLNHMQVKEGHLVKNCCVLSGWANADKLRAFIENQCKPIEDNGDKMTFYLSEKGVIYYRRDREKARNIVSVLRNFGTTEKMRSELEAMGIPFQYPKPKELLRYLIQIGVEDTGIVLDFFAGSGTTAHAIWIQQLTDNILRRFILIQLPELLDPKNEKNRPAIKFCDQIRKPQNIAELTKERLRRSGKKIAEENPMFKGDLGFRVFKLDSSNIRAWDPEPANLETALLDSVDHIKQGRSEADILYELLLKLGLDLAVPIETKKIGGKDVHAIGAGSLFVCLADMVKRDEVEALAFGIVAWRKELNPVGEVTCVFRDSGFEDNVAKTNLTAILLQSGIGNVRSI
jgi:adenine-specific DNA-methyltransferase